MEPPTYNHYSGLPTFYDRADLISTRLVVVVVWNPAGPYRPWSAHIGKARRQIISGPRAGIPIRRIGQGLSLAQTRGLCSKLHNRLIDVSKVRDNPPIACLTASGPSTSPSFHPRLKQRHNGTREGIPGPTSPHFTRPIPLSGFGVPMINSSHMHIRVLQHQRASN